MGKSGPSTDDTAGIGVVTRSGSAVLVALRAGAEGAALLARLETPLLPDNLPGQPYHAAADLPATEAEYLVRAVEQAAEDGAAAALGRIAHDLAGVAHDGPGPDAVALAGVAVVVKAGIVPPAVAGDVTAVVRNHTWMHAAEGALFRDAVLSAARRLGWQSRAVDADRLPSADAVVSALGRSAGRPWRRAEKDAARAALVLLGVDDER